MHSCIDIVSSDALLVWWNQYRKIRSRRHAACPPDQLVVVLHDLRSKNELKDSIVKTERSNLILVERTESKKVVVALSANIILVERYDGQREKEPRQAAGIRKEPPRCIYDARPRTMRVLAKVIVLQLP